MPFILDSQRAAAVSRLLPRVTVFSPLNLLSGTLLRQFLHHFAAHRMRYNLV